ncbi:MAG: hypothetical protein VKK04_25910 [Synechococcales bacterium]|nr:hypothetical protein [Synechococcales bacterium]
MITSSDKITNFRMASHFINILAIATVTAIATLSMTHHLLSRPWCIQIQPNGNQNILYGSQRCEAVKMRSLTRYAKPFRKSIAVDR